MKITLFLITLIFLFSGCSAKVQVSTMPETKIDTTDDSLVFLSKSMFDLKLKYELKKVGFDVKKLPNKINTTVGNSVSQNLNNGQIATQNISKSEVEFVSRYGLELEIGRASNWCMVNSEIYTQAFLEVSDLKTNETIFVVQGEGWTGDCSYYTGDLFPTIARKLKEEWDKHKVKESTIKKQINIKEKNEDKQEVDNI